MDRVFNFLTKEINLKDNDVIVIGNSAGPDSMALTDILLKIRKKKAIKIICAHVNHNVREESKDEEKFLKEYCDKNDIIFERMLIEKYGDDNFHNEARTIRYNFFDKIVKKYNANYLMTAHHADDLMETILMRIVRGSSLKGYGGFQTIVQKEGYKLVRPLIFVTKDQLKEYDDKNNVKYAIDKSNFKGKYTRNRYRKNVLPFLKSEDKNVHEHFLKFSHMIFECDEYINKETAKILNEMYKDSVLDINKYKEADKIIQNKIICKMLEEFYQDDLMLINDNHVSLINSLINCRKANSFVCLPNDIIAIKTYNELTIKKKTDDIYEYEIEFDEYAKLPNGHIIEKTLDTENNDNNICRIKMDEVQFPLHIRTRKVGDKMSLKKTKGLKKVKDIFIESKVPIELRDKWPIVVDSKDNIIWIPGIKKSKFTKSKSENCDIILKYQ
ncbi:MAG: tRNA lysidine(34) synthetase TilS [Clostridia bacterium]